MNGVRQGLVLLSLVWLGNRAVSGSTFLPLTPEQRIDYADAICRGTVVQVRCFRDPADGFIYTQTIVRVDEALKGRFPGIVRLLHRGGVLEDEADQDGFAPQLQVGDERLLFLTRRADGTLFATQGSASAVRLKPNDPWLAQIRHRIRNPAAAGADVLDQAVQMLEAGIAASVASSSVTGLLVDANGISSRFLACDRGEPIAYLIDADALPVGITLTQATNAVHNAFQVWAAVTSLKFVFDGLQSFGMAARDVTNNDGRIRIQLHDLYGAITNASVLGVGGRATSFNNTLFPAGGSGGRVTSNEFHRSTRGYLTLKHTETALQTLSTLEEVLGHEIGHTLSMAHSSEDPNETSAVLKQAIMYFQAHADGRGATLGSWDPPVIQQAHPTGNTPPYAYDRVIYAVTSSSPLTHPEVNQVEMTGYDLQGDTLSRLLTNANSSSAGSLALNGDFLVFTPSGLASGPPLDPTSGTYYLRVYVRFDDGTNASPYVLTRVIALLPDTKPNGAPDGLPDDWMIMYFGSATPVPGASGADDDPDGDGMTNLREFQSDSDPNDPDSCFRVTAYGGQAVQWPARPYELYEVQVSTNLSGWSRLGNPLLATNQVGAASASTGGFSNQFFRVRKVP